VKGETCFYDKYFALMTFPIVENDILITSMLILLSVTFALITNRPHSCT
jgi:hypothetical protein